MPEPQPEILSLPDRLRALIADGLTFSQMVKVYADHQAEKEPELAPYYQNAAELAYVRDGEVEIDTQGAGGAGIVSKGNDDGAYVLAWVWVPDDVAGIRADEEEG